jgi:pectin methylesterase-like acyl-CoA thioesterase
MEVKYFHHTQDDVKLVPNNNTHRVFLYIQSGVYKEKVSILATKPHINFHGQGKMYDVE